MYVVGDLPTEIADNPLARYVQGEFQKIAQEFGAPKPLLSLSVSYKLPEKYRDGTIILMDASLASSLGLASGPGTYCFREGAWRFLG